MPHYSSVRFYSGAAQRYLYSNYMLLIEWSYLSNENEISGTSWFNSQSQLNTVIRTLVLKRSHNLSWAPTCTRTLPTVLKESKNTLKDSFVTTREDPSPHVALLLEDFSVVFIYGYTLA